jgi:stage II sporulation protein M
MVFESLINPLKAEKKPWEMVFIGIIYSSFAILLSIFIFKEDASLVAIFLTTLASVPIIYSTMKMEEKKDLIYHEEKLLIKEHGKALSFLMFLFLGFVLSSIIWSSLLPKDMAESLFKTQLRDIETVEMISNGVVGNVVNTFSTFSIIFINNLKVMFFCLLFSFFYGFGSIFILSWNASVIGVAIGEFIRSGIGNNYFSLLSLGLLRYIIHGFPEILAYFTAGLAGGIISIAIVRHDFREENFKHIVIDSLDLIILSTALLFVAALLEVFVTPLLF